MVTQLCEYDKNHLVVDFKWVKFIVCELCSSVKLLKKTDYCWNLVSSMRTLMLSPLNWETEFSDLLIYQIKTFNHFEHNC